MQTCKFKTRRVKQKEKNDYYYHRRKKLEFLEQLRADEQEAVDEMTDKEVAAEKKTREQLVNEAVEPWEGEIDILRYQSEFGSKYDDILFENEGHSATVTLRIEESTTIELHLRGYMEDLTISTVVY